MQPRRGRWQRHCHFLTYPPQAHEKEKVAKGRPLFGVHTCTLDVRRCHYESPERKSGPRLGSAEAGSDWRCVRIAERRHRKLLAHVARIETHTWADMTRLARTCHEATDGDDDEAPVFGPAFEEPRIAIACEP